MFIITYSTYIIPLLIIIVIVLFATLDPDLMNSTMSFTKATFTTNTP